MKQIAFIGLGHMGALMTTNLSKAGYLLDVFGLARSAIDGPVVAGINVARNARDTVQGADMVISTLPASQHVKGLYLNDDGLFACIAPGTLVLGCSTVALTSAHKIRTVVRERGLAMLDAPVSGSAVGVATGTLTFMVSGDTEALGKTRPLFEAVGRNIFHADPDGAGQVIKVYNNQLLAVLVIGIAEAVALGMTDGLEAKVLAEITRHSSGDNWALEAYNPWPGVVENTPMSRGYSGGFMAQSMAKDLGLARETARASTSSTPMGSLALSLHRLLLKQGHTGRDFSVVQKLLDPTQSQQTDRRIRAQASRFDSTRSPP